MHNSNTGFDLHYTQQYQQRWTDNLTIRSAAIDANNSPLGEKHIEYGTVFFYTRRNKIKSNTQAKI